MEPSAAKRGVVDELHKPARRNFPRRKVEIRGLFDLWQADLVEMIPYASVNRGFKYLLTVIDTCSKYAWAEPVKTKKGVDVTAAMVKVLKSAKKAPKNLQVDQGGEFFNSHFEKLMTSHGINLYNSYSTKKASIVERFNRTLKTRMWKRFSLQGTYEWINLLEPLLHEYNHGVHRSTGMKPAEVTQKDEKRLVKRLARLDRPNTGKRKFKRGDYVRLSKHKALFEKGYTPNWTTEIFKVKWVHRTRPITYVLEDLKGNPVKGGFYAEELQKTNFKDIYLVEKVVRKNKDRALVKWLGFDSSHNSWINTKDIA